mgnify:CR=1 FL=1
MKTEFSTSWISSKQPRKQRKYNYGAPLHIRHSFLSTHLSKGLREKYKTRNLPIRKGDEALVMRGSFARKKAKVIRVDIKRTRVVLEGINRTKREGSKVEVFFHPSSLEITALNTDDKKRLKRLNLKETKGEKNNAPNKSGT